MTRRRAHHPPLTAAQQALVESARDLVKAVARSIQARYGNALLPKGELRAAGNIGLVEAAQSFDETLGVPFEAFARRRVSGAMLNAIARELPHLRSRVAATEALEDFLEAPHDVGDPLRDTDEDCRVRLEAYTDGAAASLFAGFSFQVARGGEEQIIAREAAALATRALEDAVKTLSERDQTLVRLRYRDGRDFKDIAKEMGMSYTTLRRYHADVMKRLAKRLSAHRSAISAE